MEIIDIRKHPEGGHIVTIEQCPSQDGDKVREYLRVSGFEWYSWPDISKITYFSNFEDAWDSHHMRLKYNPPPVKTYKPKPKGNPNKCMFCHTSMSGMSAQCLKCGGAMHLSCSDENGDRCITPGCVS